jgi:glycosyltransferase involved in cell wall biosynthesis
MKKVLILQNKILHYRKPFYNKLAEKYDITVLHSGNVSVENEDQYKEIITPVKSITKFKFQKGVLKAIKPKEYDVVIAMMDIFWVNNIIASFVYPKSTVFAWWGIIASKNSFGNKIRGLFLRNLPTIFYTDAGRLQMQKEGFQSPKYTYCNNTFHIKNRIPCHLSDEKDSFLFVGSLEPRKKIDVLIKAFATAIPEIPEHIQLNIIGDGESFEKAQKLIKELKIKNRVHLIGRITKTELLQTYYQKAIFSVSFGQAGLGVLQSLGYGVPFLTNKNAIRGGEISNIIQNETGVLCEETELDLTKYIAKYSNDIKAATALGLNAFNHYTENCTIHQMSRKFEEVIDSEN